MVPCTRAVCEYGGFFASDPCFCDIHLTYTGTFIQCLVHLEKEVKMFQLFNRLICWRRGLHGCASIINGASCYPLVGIHCQGPQGQRRAWLAMHTETSDCCLTKRILYRVFYCITMFMGHSFTSLPGITSWFACIPETCDIHSREAI